uniref:P/Homo B domain-containing protein n=1 Tax=Chromera velia CCMP2878 TaxID=1169474 RepID=A0A0G4HXU7_9ALVE|eukprot:Cvel_9349.t1-p1 / transcript=Cvel_9349.t1 / gene=Cvel_9349 / organism=Chromera_velia_CCMP2878 / gene_product=hypothetical protein / transcript_product=hypothetical protein / location=Cvel_scaffold537:1764-5599(-) / protein_length=647 / sequence_SO=supercontig / SO=protein_coding / is_pseudo=false
MRYNSTTSTLNVHKNDVYNCKQIIASEFERYMTASDWALVQLERPAADREPAKLQTDPVANNDPVFMVSHFWGAPSMSSGSPVPADATPSTTPAPSPTPEWTDETGTETSDGTELRPYCTWGSSCDWNEDTKQECATALCEAAGYRNGTFVSASNNPCDESFVSGYAYYHVLGRTGVRRDDYTNEAQITATCSQKRAPQAPIPDNAIIDASPAAFFVATYDNTHGSSGAPVFNAQTSEVIGINARGSRDDLVVDKEKWCYRFNQCPNPNSFTNGLPSDSQCPGMHAIKVSHFAHVLDQYLEGRSSYEPQEADTEITTVSLLPNASLPLELPPHYDPEFLSMHIPEDALEDGASYTVEAINVVLNMTHVYPDEVSVTLTHPSGQSESVGTFPSSPRNATLKWDQGSQIDGDTVTLAMALGTPIASSDFSVNKGSTWTMRFRDCCWGDAGNVTVVDFQVLLKKETENEEVKEEKTVREVTVMGRLADPTDLARGNTIPNPEKRYTPLSRMDGFERNTFAVSFPVEIQTASQSDAPAPVGKMEEQAAAPEMELVDIALNVTIDHSYPRDLYGKLTAPSGMEIGTGQFPRGETDSRLFGRMSTIDDYPLFTAFARAQKDDYAGDWTFEIHDADGTRGKLTGAELTLFFQEK